jgi:hypothetical protein
MDKLKTGSGKRLRTEALTEVALPVPYDAAAMPGASVLGTDGRLYTSIKVGTSYDWTTDFTSLLKPISLISTGEAPRTPANQVGSVRNDVASDAEHRERTFILLYSQGSATPTVGCARAKDDAGSPEVVNTNGNLGAFQVYGWTGFEHGIAGRLLGRVDGVPAESDLPGQWQIQTAPAGTVLPVTVMTVKANGNVLIGNTTGTERLSVTGNIQLTSTADSYRVGTNNVVGSRKTGWAAPTGTATRTAFDTATVAVADLAERVKALIDDLTSHGLIGA